MAITNNNAESSPVCLVNVRFATDWYIDHKYGGIAVVTIKARTVTIRLNIG